jgi:integrase
VHDARRTCATLLVDLDVHPRVIMRILRHAQISVTMDIYAKASGKATREALERLGESLDDVRSRNSAQRLLHLLLYGYDGGPHRTGKGPLTCVGTARFELATP